MTTDQVIEADVKFGIDVVVAWNDRDTLEQCLLKSEGLNGCQLVLFDNRAANQGLPTIFNTYKRKSTADWLVFCHQDIVFSDPSWPREVAGLAPDACYGPIGVDEDGHF